MNGNSHIPGKWYFRSFPLSTKVNFTTKTCKPQDIVSVFVPFPFKGKASYVLGKFASPSTVEKEIKTTI
jgi:hypothetical protein